MSATLEQRLTGEELRKILLAWRNYECKEECEACIIHFDNCMECFIKDFNNGKINFEEME